MRKKLEVVLIIAVIALLSIFLWNMLQNNEPATQEFTLIDIEGNTFTLSDFGGKIVIVEFMATWCGYCKQQIYHFEDVWEKYSDKIIIIFVDVDPSESEETLRTFAKQFPYDEWIWASDTINLAKSYEVTAIPKTIIIDQNGRLRYSHMGVTATSTLLGEIESLLK